MDRGLAGRRRRLAACVATAVVALAALVGCSGDDERRGEDPAADDAIPSEETAVVTIAASRFEPREIRVAPGTAVTFVNTDPFAHTVTSRPESSLSFASGELGEGAEFTVDFDQPGSYEYFCEIHPTMRAAVVIA